MNDLDMLLTGLSLKAHPISFFRAQLDELRIAPARRLASLPDGRYVRVGGLVLVHRRRPWWQLHVGGTLRLN